MDAFAYSLERRGYASLPYHETPTITPFLLAERYRPTKVTTAPQWAMSAPDRRKRSRDPAGHQILSG